MKNKLDPFRERLLEWEGEGRQQKEMRAELLADGCSVSASQLSDYLARLRKDREEKSLFELIASGGRMNREMEAAFTANPAPDIEQLIQVTKTLVMSLQVQGTANPKLLGLANTMQGTVLEYLSGRTRAENEARKIALGERRVKLLEEKAAQADAAKQVTESGLSAEEKQTRMKQIFGM